MEGIMAWAWGDFNEKSEYVENNCMGMAWHGHWHHIIRELCILSCISSKISFALFVGASLSLGKYMIC
jgi:hypothetical protein